MSSVIILIFSRQCPKLTWNLIWSVKFEKIYQYYYLFTNRLQNENPCVSHLPRLWPWPLRPWPWTTFSDTKLKTRIFTFLTLVTLTFDLWRSNSSEIWWSFMCVPKFRSVGPTVQRAESKQTGTHTYTHRQTNTTKNITYSANVGGKKQETWAKKRLICKWSSDNFKQLSTKTLIKIYSIVLRCILYMVIY